MIRIERRRPRRGARRRRGAAASGLLATVLAACGGGPGASLPPDPPTVGVEMVDFRFRYPEIPGGRVVFRVENLGTQMHELALVPLEDDVPPIEVELRDQRPRFVQRLAGAPQMEPGRELTFAVDLHPGRYAMICFVVDPDGTSHALEGMASEFRIRG